MYKCFIVLIILTFISCNKQPRLANEENEPDVFSIMDNEESSQEDIFEENGIRPDIVSIANRGNFPLENIIGTWLSSTPQLLIEIEFTNDGVLYIKELNIWNNNFVEDSYTYKIEENIIIENIKENNDFGREINLFLLSPGAYITKLDNRSLCFEKSYKFNSFLFYKGSIKESLEKQNTRSNYENKLKEFISNEVLNGIIFHGDENDKNGVIDTYGVPLKDEIIEYSDGRRYEGGRYLIGIREITYEDLTHRYYVFTTGIQYYVDVIIDKKLDRLKSINIGSASEEVTSIFGSNYWRKEGEDIIYMLGDDYSSEPPRWIRFSIENNVVVKISYIITSWE